MEIEVSALREKLEDRESRFKKVEDEHKKKLSLKEKKLSQFEQKYNDLRDQQIKIKTQNEITQEKLSNSLSAKTKELILLTEKHGETERRLNTMMEECRKKDQGKKQLDLRLNEKDRIINNLEK